MTYFFSVASHAAKSLGAMTFELDHLFICTDIGAEEADRLVAFGLVEGRKLNR